MRLPWLDPQDPFPPVTQALREPNGLLAAGAGCMAALDAEKYLDALKK